MLFFVSSHNSFKQSLLLKPHFYYCLVFSCKIWYNEILVYTKLLREIIEPIGSHMSTKWIIKESPFASNQTGSFLSQRLLYWNSIEKLFSFSKRLLISFDWMLFQVEQVTSKSIIQHYTSCYTEKLLQLNNPLCKNLYAFSVLYYYCQWSMLFRIDIKHQAKNDMLAFSLCQKRPSPNKMLFVPNVSQTQRKVFDTRSKIGKLCHHVYQIKYFLQLIFL